MGVYIKGMEMPKEKPIAMVMYPNGTVLINGKDVEFAVEIPKHGRLIDADALKKIIADAKHMDASIYDGKTMYSDHLCVGADYDDVCEAIDEVTTIIEAEG